LVRDGCIVPTLENPELAFIRESTNEKYIPDVYFRVFLLVSTQN
jgi:nuclear protein localization family protein 4